MNEKPKENERTKDWWKPVVFIAIIVVLFIVMNGIGFGETLQDIQDWIASLGMWGPIVFFGIYLGAVIATIPGTIFGVIAGALFGSVVGVTIISVSSTVGASITFLIARYFARDSIARWLSKNTTMQKLDQLTQEQGMILVGLTRLIPLFPFTLLNYGFGLTKVSFKTYVFWSWICMLPGTIIVVVGTDVITQGLSQGRVPWELLGVLCITVFILVLLTWYARKQLQQKRKKTKETSTNEEMNL
ncbi:MAG: TVP38/TMEM64 family protein [Candidatus Thermoplasmatota archaeon]|nr:TVP38/TMEM64 family protein [Candidatus Thermoplasmatota archaeon]